jgi:hypothetical protein
MVAKAKRGMISAQDRLAGLFEPDVLLPAQFFAAFRRMNGLDRERLLMLAVLEDAVDCFQKYAFAKDPRGRQLFAEAAEWVDSFDKGWLFSFENICDTLEIAPGYVRRGLSAWRERQHTLDVPERIQSIHAEGSAAADTADNSLRKVSA